MFRWTDRHGVAHDLERYDEIDEERRQIRQELLDLLPRMNHDNDAIFIAVHGEYTVLRARMDAVKNDLQRFVRHEAERAYAMIDNINLEASFCRNLHRSYDQHGERALDDAALAASPSPDQCSVLRRQAARDGQDTVILPASFGEAHAMLVAHPETCRTPLPDSAPCFEWTDRHMHYHQVRDLRQIEAEYIDVADELALIRPKLSPGTPIEDVLTSIEQSRVGIDRVAILERTMNRWRTHVIGVARLAGITFLDQLEKSDGRNV